MSARIFTRVRRFALALVLASAALPALAATTVEYIHTDALGSPVAVTNAAGQVIERREYEPYGRQLTPALEDGPGYTGHVSDAATGLVYAQQRYLDPAIGRFLSVDPVSAAGTANFNRYNYANNNPYRFLDPDGREAGSICAKTPKRCSAVIQVNGSSSSGRTGAPSVGTPPSSTHPRTQPAQSGSPSSANSFAPAIPRPIEVPVINFRWINALLSKLALWTTVLSLSGDTPRYDFYIHYGYARDANNFAGGLRPGSYATKLPLMTGSQAQQMLALPHISPPDAWYSVRVRSVVPVIGPSTVPPDFGMPGGGIQYQFPEGTPPGSVTGPYPLPQK